MLAFSLSFLLWLCDEVHREIHENSLFAQFFEMLFEVRKEFVWLFVHRTHPEFYLILLFSNRLILNALLSIIKKEKYISQTLKIWV